MLSSVLERNFMYRVEFYEDTNGYSELWEYLEELRCKSHNSKEARIQYQQVSLYIQLLQEYGTNLSARITKYIGSGIWELRPGNNRVFYFFFRDDTYVLLHHYRKKTQKTPRREIERAITERQDYIAREEVTRRENMGRL